MTFKEKIVKLRKLKGLTQDEFASAVGVSRQAVYKWESGQSYPEVAKLLEMKILFNISIDDLLDENYEVVVPEKKRKRVSKAVKAEVEKEIIPEAVAVEEPVKEEAPVAAVSEEAPAVEEVAEPAVVEEPVVEEPVIVVEEIAPAAPAKEEEEEKDEPKKKSGFFGRLFGKK